MRVARNDQEKLNNSVHEFSSVHKKSPSVGGIDMHELSLHQKPHHNHSKSLMKNLNPDELAMVDKKKEILDKKRYE